MKLRTPVRPLLAALGGLQPRPMLSRDAGRYLCNYLCWRAAETTSTGTRPRFATFIHVPPVRRVPRRKRDKGVASLDDLTAAGARALVAVVAAARR
jgi:pyroglutamyl-peptidase